MGDHAIERARVPLIAVALAVFELFVSAAAAGRPTAGVWLNEEQIRTEFVGRRLEGVYPSGTRWAETIETDGSTNYEEGEKRWRGKWWVEESTFCFSYPPPGVGGCFRVLRTSLNCYELYEAGSKMIEEEDVPFAGDRWNGRLWSTDRPLTCEHAPTA